MICFVALVQSLDLCFEGFQQAASTSSEVVSAGWEVTKSNIGREECCMRHAYDWFTYCIIHDTLNSDLISIVTNFFFFKSLMPQMLVLVNKSKESVKINHCCAIIATIIGTWLFVPAWSKPCNHAVIMCIIIDWNLVMQKSHDLRGPQKGCNHPRCIQLTSECTLYWQCPSEVQMSSYYIHPEVCFRICIYMRIWYNLMDDVRLNAWIHDVTDWKWNIRASDSFRI